MNDKIKQENDTRLQDNETCVTEHIPQVSVCMPMYNASKYLRECIDSVLAQTFKDFEFLIVDDGSDDDSVEIVKSYHDDRIRLMQNKHDYIGSLNMLLEEARGKYIARMDADDVMVSCRLQIQFDYMESHPEIDIIGSGMQCFGESDDVCEPFRIGEASYLDFLDCCALYHPTVVMRVASIISSGIKYRQEYIYAEDYDFWCEAITKGLKIANISNILIKYRVNPFQVTRTKSEIQREHSITVKSKLIEKWSKITENYLNAESATPLSNNKLTAVIPFFNEGIELFNTVTNIRATVKESVDIIVINDHSDDGIDYREMLEGLSVHYVENPYRMGPAVSKEKGVQCSTTPFFILLDAHMRFYQNDWADIIIEELENNSRQVTCCQTKALKKIDGIVQETKTGTTYGAFVYLGVKQYMPMSVWNSNPNVLALQDNHIMCVLGATYASSKTYWNQINGFRGLVGYGCEEALISLKAWIEGGRCKLIPNVVVGHIYKDKCTYSLIGPCYIYNYLFIAHLLFPTSLMSKAEGVIRSLALGNYPFAVEMLRATKQWRKRLKNKLHSCSPIYDIEYLKRINYVVPPQAYKDIMDRMQIVPEILSFCESQQLQEQDIGIAHGKMALVIFYLLYYKDSNEKKWNNKAHLLLTEIRRFITQTAEHWLSFADGLSGIGWGLTYLLDQELLSIEETQPLLDLIDKNIAIISPKRMRDSSIAKGHTGIAIYVVARLGCCLRKGIPHHINTDFIDELKSVCYDYVTFKCPPTDIYSYSINRQMSLYGTQGWSTLRTDIADIMELPTSILKNKKHWRINLQTGCIGYALNLINTKYNVLQNQ